MKLLNIIKGVESVPLPAKTPDVTRAQVAGWTQFAGAVAVASGEKPEVGAVIVGSSALVAFGITLADAIIRHGRAGALAAIHSATGSGGPGVMGSGAPEGEELPLSPTLQDGGDGTGTTPPADASGPPPTAPPPTPEEIAAAQAVLARAQAAQTPPQQ